VISGVVFQRLPNAPAFVAGVFNYRGAITPVVDLCLLLTGNPCAARLSSRIVLFDCALGPEQPARVVGLLAERVTETRRLGPGASVQTGFSSADEVVIDDGQMISLLDLDALVARAFAPLLTAASSDWSISNALAQHHE
jgi:chemotaxis-related protein WspB